jgi:hypothetical protein
MASSGRCAVLRRTLLGEDFLAAGNLQIADFGVHFGVLVTGRAPRGTHQDGIAVRRLSQVSTEHDNRLLLSVMGGYRRFVSHYYVDREGRTRVARLRADVVHDPRAQVLALLV